MPRLDITSQERGALRAAAHPLHPVVLIGDKGLTESVLKEIDLSLTAHGLIKVRVSGPDRQARDTMLEAICETVSCAPVHHLGKTFILYRPNEAMALARAEANATRAQRKPSQPYTPKKQAALGATRTRSAEKAERSARRTQRTEAAPVPASARPRRASVASSDRVGPGIPRRTGGSALSLRPGARSTIGRAASGRTRKVR